MELVVRSGEIRVSLVLVGVRDFLGVERKVPGVFLFFPLGKNARILSSLKTDFIPYRQ